jgi:diguanylate cyclase (GGDEF)-like protein
MKRTSGWLGLLIVWALVAYAGAPQPLTRLSQIHALSNDQAQAGLPVAFEATVTYYDPGLPGLWVQDGGVAVYVEAFTRATLAPGDRVLIRGTTQNSFRPIVVSSDVTRLGQGALPKAEPASFGDLISGNRDCLRVVVRATVRAADPVAYANRRIIDLQLLMDGGYIEALVPSTETATPDNLLDAEVETTGVVAAQFDGKKQLIGAALYVNSLDDIRVVKRPDVSAGALPVTPMDRVMNGYRVRDLTQRMRVQGAITYYHPGTSVVLQDGSRSILLLTQTEQPMRIGDLADGTGFPDASQGYLTLTHSAIEDTGKWAPAAARSVSLDDLRSGENAFDLVSTEGRLLMAVREATEDEYVLVAGGHLFSAIYRHLENTAENQLPAMPAIEAGSTVRVTGICMPYGADPFNGAKDVDMLLRSPDDVAVMAPPSALSVRNLVILAGFLLVALLVACVWGWALSRKVSRQMEAMAKRVEAEAALEKRRSQILEDINGTRPLEEILEQITELVAFKLGEAQCWCERGAGTREGARKEAPENWETLRHEILSRSGPPHGSLVVAVNPLAPARAHAGEALAIGAWLATLAIETRGLYSDLVHRSEYDQLTNVYNRFVLEEHIDAQLKQASSQELPFGLVYIDLDDFKQVNDQYGHRIGDVYLQQSALRMKHQLRSGDLLARIGGDEFAVLIPRIQSRNEAQEIARRLERCFESPFDMQECVLQGSASIGVAVYPQDGTTRDSLLSAADASMYVAKNVRRAEKPARDPNEITTERHGEGR